jgi:hypothetical protein
MVVDKDLAVEEGSAGLEVAARVDSVGFQEAE